MKEIIIDGQQISKVLKDGLVVWSKKAQTLTISTLVTLDSRDRFVEFFDTSIEVMNDYTHFEVDGLMFEIDKARLTSERYTSIEPSLIEHFKKKGVAFGDMVTIILHKNPK